MFCFVLFCFVLFCFVLFCFVLFLSGCFLVSISFKTQPLLLFFFLGVFCCRKCNCWKRRIVWGHPWNSFLSCLFSLLFPSFSLLPLLSLSNSPFLSHPSLSLSPQGLVADRFAVRNSGAVGVCEGAGDHACGIFLF